MFGIGYVTKKIEPCTKALFYQHVSSKSVKSACDMIARMVKNLGETTDEKKQRWLKQRIGEAKRTLPCITPMAHFKDNRRIVANAIPSGLNMIDIDHVENPRELWESIKAITDPHQKPLPAPPLGEGDEEKPLPDPPLGEGNGKQELGIRGGLYPIALVHITPSTQGLRIIFVQPEGMTIEEAQTAMARSLKVAHDQCTKDLARCSFLVPEDYILYIDEELLFKKPTTQKPLPDPTEEKPLPDPHQKPLPSPPLGEGDEKKPLPDPPLGEGDGKQELGIRGGLFSSREMFKSVPYAEIIEQILFNAGYDGTPSEGERNNALYMLARNLRYCCDFDCQFVSDVLYGWKLEEWGLSAKEVERTIESAVKSVRKVMMPSMLRSIIDRAARRIDRQNDELFESAFDYNVPCDGVIGEFVKIQPKHLQNAAYLVAVTCFGTLLTKLRGRGCDGSVIAPNFMLTVSAPQATGKSFMRRMANQILAPIIEEDKRQRKRLNEIEKKNKRNKDKEGYEEEDFDGAIRLIGTNTSNRIFLERMDLAKGQHLMMIAEEIDSITKAEKAGKWSEKSDIYRLAYDNSEWGMDYASENSYKAMVALYFNLLFSGTPAAVARFFNDIENGLVTRFLFIDLPDTYGIPRSKLQFMDEEMQKQIEEKCQRMYERMQNTGTEDGLIWMDTTKMVADTLEHYDEVQRRMFLCNQDDVCRDLARRRYADYVVKIMMIETWLNDGKYTDEIRDRAISVMNICTDQLIANYGDEINRSLYESVEHHEQAKSRNRKRNVLAMLPDQFTAAEYRGALVDCGGNASSSGQYLKRLVKVGLIENVSYGVYRKVVSAPQE